MHIKSNRIMITLKKKKKKKKEGLTVIGIPSSWRIKVE